MLISYSKEHKFFIYVYFITITILLLDQIDTFTIGALLRKIKYLYIAVMIAYIFYKHRTTRRQILAIFPLIVMSLYAILWGTIFKKPELADTIQLHVRECLIFYLLVLVTFYYVSINNCFFLFIELSYISLVIALAFAAVTHIRDRVNPVYFIYIFNTAERVRNAFGFGAFGYLGNYCFCVIALSLILFHKIKKMDHNRRALTGLLIGDLMALYMACCASSRSTIIVTGITLFYYFCFDTIHNLRNKGAYIFIVVLMIVVTIFVVNYCITKGTRSLNIEGNINAFHQIGNPLTGMGYVENHCFQEDRGIFSVQTTSLDISYVYYYFSTGLLGCIFLGVTGISILLMIIFSRSDYKIPVLTVFIAMLYYAYWQVNLFTYTYYSNLFYMVSYLGVITLFNSKRREPIVKIHI